MSASSLRNGLRAALLLATCLVAPLGATPPTAAKSAAELRAWAAKEYPGARCEEIQAGGKPVLVMLGSANPGPAGTEVIVFYRRGEQWRHVLTRALVMEPAMVRTREQQVEIVTAAGRVLVSLPFVGLY